MGHDYQRHGAAFYIFEGLVLNDRRDTDLVLSQLAGRRGDALAAERLRTLQEKGWNAFKEQRDEAFKV